MIRTNTLRKALLISLLTLLTISQACKIPVGTNVWRSIGPEGGGIQALAIDPATPTKLFAGTFDSGVSWSEVNTGLTANDVLTLSIDPATLTTLFAGTEGGVFIMQ